MTDPPRTSPSSRSRLRLSVGSIAELGEDCVRAPDRVVWGGAARTGGEPVVITLFAPPPVGPGSAPLFERFRRLRQLGHRSFELPIAEGELDGCPWIVESAPSIASFADRLATGTMPLPEAVALVRDLARALAALHRHDLVHGAIDLEVARVDGNGIRLGGFGLSLNATSRDDLDALGRVAWSLLSGERRPSLVRPLSRLRRGVSPRLDALVTALVAPDPADRPASAEAVLQALDAVPTPRRNLATSLADVDLRDGRPRVQGSVGWLLVGAVIMIAAVLLSART